MVRRLSTDPSVASTPLSKQLMPRVLSYARGFRVQIAIFLCCVVVDAVAGVIPPLLLQRIIDQGVLAGNRRLVVVLALAVAGVAVANAGISLISRWFSARIGEGLIFQLRTQVFDHVTSQPLAFFSRTHTGKLTSRLQSDVLGAQQAFTSTLSTVVSNIVGLAVTLVAMLTLSWQLTLASLVLLPVFLVPARVVGTKLADLTRNAQQLNGELSGAMTERFSVSGALLVKLFGRPKDEHDQFAETAAAVQRTGIRIAMIGRFFVTSLTLVSSLAVALVYGAGGWLAIDKLLTVGTLTALAGLLLRLYGPLVQLTNVRIDVMNALVSFDRVFEVLDLEPTIADQPGARSVSGIASVEFRDVDFTYPDAAQVSLPSLEPVMGVTESANQPVLNGITFEVAPGKTTALVGPSGSGKTTITHLVARLFDATGGTVLVGGDDVRTVRLDSLRASVGYVTQDAHMFHDTIGSNLRYAKPDATDAELWRVLTDAQVADLVRRLPDGLSTIVGERGYRLSGGERQRFAIARLLLKAPAIVVLDEATAHLDTESEVAVQRAFDETMNGRTAIVVAHRLSTIRAADQILVIEGGRIVQRGTHDELLAQGGLYSELYEAQFAAQSQES